MRARVLLLLPLLVATPVLADEGRIEINQARALAGGVTPSDPNGFPVTLDASGSYVLTSDLVVPLGVAGIELTTGGITIDLNGFGLYGPVICSGNGSGVSCSGSSAPGVSGLDQAGCAVHDGTVRGFETAGVLLGERASVRRVQARQNKGHGVLVGDHSRVRESTSLFNEGSGIVAADRAVVTGVGGFANRDNGISITTGVISDSVADQNGDHGIVCGTGCAIVGNASTFNEDDGVHLTGGGAVALDNVLSLNENDGFEDAGIALGAHLQGNTFQDNAGSALRTSNGRGSYRENVIHGAPTVTGAWSDAGGNTCNGSTTCP